jgi:two-component SAPR family response regulator
MRRYHATINGIWCHNEMWDDALTRSPTGQLRIQTFGSACVHLGSKLLAAAEWSYAKPRELLYFLASHPASTKDQIGAALWPWTSPAKLRNSFHTTLYHLRRALGAPDWVTYEHGRYAFNRTLPYTCDTEALEAGLPHVRDADPSAIPYLVEAVEAYQGEFLADVSGQPWIEDRRGELRSAFEQVLLALGAQYERANRPAEAAEIYKRAIRHDNLLEVAHRQLIRCYVNMGEPAQALRQYRELTVLFRDELGIIPSAATRELHDALLIGASPIRSPSG